MRLLTPYPPFLLIALAAAACGSQEAELPPTAATAAASAVATTTEPVAAESSAAGSSIVAPGGAIAVTGLDADPTRLVEEIVAAFPSDAGLERVEFGPAPPAPENEDGTRPSRAGALWARATYAAARDDAERVRRFWLESLLVPALWRRLDPAGVRLAGGEAAAPDITDALAAPPLGARFEIAENADALLYRDGANETGTSLSVDGAQLTERIRAAAPGLGLELASVRLWGIDGTVVEVEARAADPVAYLRDHRLDYVYGDQGRLEGRLLVVRDAAGEIVWIDGYSRGLNVGVGWSSPRYAAAFADSGGATTPSPTEPPDPSIPYTGG